jgi:hypothetical protein
MNTPVSELLGSTPQETQEVKDAFKVVLPCFKGTVLPMSFEYSPLDVVGLKCNNCGDNAEHKETTEADPNYIRKLCTQCRDKASAPKKKKNKRPLKYVRVAGHSKRKPSYTIEEFEQLTMVRI